MDVNGGSFVTITGNVFNYNRHAVTASGRPFTATSRASTTCCRAATKTLRAHGGYYNQHMDVHGRGAAGREYVGGPAGTQFDVSLNTFRGAQGYGFLGPTRPAFMQRGMPRSASYFRDNVLVHGSLDEAVRLKSGDPRTWTTVEPSTLKFHAGGNRYDTDTIDASSPRATSTATAVTDVFVANGTAWFFSRGGKRPGSSSTRRPNASATWASPTSTTTASPTCSTATRRQRRLS